MIYRGLCLYLLFALIQFGEAKIRITKSWRAAATQRNKATLAVRTNEEIDKCEWVYGRDSYTSEDRGRDITVEITDQGTLCKLVIDRADSRDHDGKWDVVVYGQCDTEDFRRYKRQASDGVNFPQNPGQVVSNLTPGLSSGPKIKNTRGDDRRGTITTSFGGSRDRFSSKLSSDCENKAEVFGIDLEVGESDELIALAGQDKIYGLLDQEVTLTARTNQRPDNCIVEFNRRRVIELRNGQDDCDRSYRGTSVCVENYESRPDGIYACNVKIEGLNRDVEGDWEITAELEGRRTSLRETVAVEVFVTETPERVIMRHDGREVTSRDRIKPSSGANLVIQCEVEGGGREVDVELFVGNKVPRNMEINTCRAESRDAKCVEFEFRPSADFSDEDVYCQAIIPGVDLSEERNARASAQLEVGTGSPTLVNGQDGKITVCTDGSRERDEFEFEVIFESNPRPTRDIEWEMKSHDRDSVRVSEGDSDDGYESFLIETVRGSDNRYIAAMLIDELSREDIERGNTHELRVDNGVGREVTFEITLDDSRDCQSSGSSSYRCNVRTDQYCRCNLRGDECCDSHSTCKTGTCCQRCANRNECLLCDDEKEDCMELKSGSSTSGSGSSSSSSCRKGDRDCICVEDDDRKEYCCTERSSNCQTCRRRDPDTNCFCDRDDRNTCVIVERSTAGQCDTNDVATRARQVLLESCLKMSSTLLEAWKPDGSKRTTSSSSSDRDIQNDIDDYFRTASCTGFERDIRDYAQDANANSDRRRPLTRLSGNNGGDGTPEIGFLSNRNSPNKVEKVAFANGDGSEKGEGQPDPALLDQFQDILALQDKIQEEDAKVAELTDEPVTEEALTTEGQMESE